MNPLTYMYVNSAGTSLHFHNKHCVVPEKLISIPLPSLEILI